MEPLVSSQINHGLGYNGFLLKLCDQIYFVFRFVTKENVLIQSQFQNIIDHLIHYVIQILVKIMARAF